ncbi:MAG TPA: diacylglycerol kinase family protein [Ktedonobacterales bacterium]|nr:diacylglycerol kinase family protein [Ktedonobacterales bacterium]
MDAQQSGKRPATRRTLLVSSPNAGNATRAGQLTTQLERLGITVARQVLVDELDHLPPQGLGWRDQGYDLVVAAGGDGTVGAVATHLTGSELPLAILPLGTANDVARSLYLPMDISEACVAIAGAIPMDIDVGQVMPGLTAPLAYAAEQPAHPAPGDPSPAAGACFLHAATLGLNVEFARLATDSLRRQRLGRMTYAASALEAVTHYHPVDVTLHVYGMEGAEETEETDDADTANQPGETIIQSRAVQVSVVNTPVFGGRANVRLPDVSLGDRLLDFMIIEAIDAQQLRHTVQQLLAALRTVPNQPDQPADAADSEREQEAPRLPGVRRFRAKAVTIETADAMDVTLDGEIRTHTPVMIRVSPQPLRVLVSPRAKRLLMRDGPSTDSGA